MDVLEPGWPLSCVVDPRCFLCDLFLPLFLQQDRHLGIWHVTTCMVALMSQCLMCCCISFISDCAYVSWRHNSSCCAVFGFGASGSWSNLVMVICRDQCGVAFLECGRHHTSWLIVCCCHCGRSFYFVGMEDRSGSVDSFFCIPLVWLVERLSLPSSVFVRHVFFHGDLSICCLLGTKKLVRICVRFRSKWCLLVQVLHDLIL
jgi:hypothetical protein